MSDSRYLAAKLLCKTFSGGSFSNIQLNSGLKNSDLDDRDKKLCSAVYYGVIERKIYLDYIIGQFSSRPVGKLDDVILNILRCGLYQILFMDNVPDNASVNESVSLAKKFGKKSASGMVNAVLRNFIRQGKSINLPEDKLQRYSIEYSAPPEFVQSLISDYGEELTENLLSDALGSPPVTVRMNRLKCTEEQFISSLRKIKAVKKSILPDCFELSGDVTSTEAFKKGYFHVQDLASQLCCMSLAPDENDLVLDICSAPGGKTFTMSELMNGKGRIMAFDLHEKRVKLVRDGAERLGLSNIETAVGDALKFNPELPKFTKILCDVPCSGLGVVRRKPEIKYKDFGDFAGLPEIQYSIAENALKYLAVGGEMVYSTCTLRKAENEQVVEKLLADHPEIEPVMLPEPLGEKFGISASIFPCHFGSDGFFISKFRKVR
ncbi:MAG: 16S rRNA (cytosine(967)-C(5))-methyltransferase RsmB [Ruminococcus flavefaciens]|nr:16S rRNA (cytosine(967)-C(5))-methyltransferase RsmB [Ruminococcus flavefaciens]